MELCFHNKTPIGDFEGDSEGEKTCESTSVRFSHLVGDDVNADWTKFDIQRVLRVLRLANPVDRQCAEVAHQMVALSWRSHEEGAATRGSPTES